MVREGISAHRSISNEDAQRLLDSLTQFEGEASAEDVAHATPEFARAHIAPFLKKNWLALLIAIVSVIHADASNRATIDAIREHDAQISSEILNLRDAIRVMNNDAARSGAARRMNLARAPATGRATDNPLCNRSSGP
jgi:hypothetical protein